ncbi:MAG: ABC transporter permease [Halodesulfurarchaeum sp.]
MPTFLADLLDATISAGTIFIIGSLGEIISERAGILNLGMEGMMLVGALTGYMATFITGNVWIGLGVAMVCGILMSLIHAFLTITLKSDQVISGVMLTLLGTGLTSYFGSEWTGRSIQGMSDVVIPVLVKIPVLGQAVFANPATDYIAFALVPAVWYLLNRTNLGLEIISVGEDPETADTMGVSVFRLRYLAVMIGGALAGLAGAHLSLAYAEIWTGGLTSGRGWIVVALVIFARWSPIYTVAGAYLFGLLEALQIRIQGFELYFDVLPGVVNGAIGFFTSPQIMATYPYFITVIVLAITVARSRQGVSAGPSALQQSYSREMD